MDPADIWIQNNPEIRIGIPDHLWLRFWRWQRFALSEHSVVLFVDAEVKQPSCALKVAGTLWRWCAWSAESDRVCSCILSVQRQSTHGPEQHLWYVWYQLLGSGMSSLLRIWFPCFELLDCVSNNEPTPASCSFVKHGLILIILGKQHQHTVKNYVHIQLSLSLPFCLFDFK